MRCQGIHADKKERLAKRGEKAKTRRELEGSAW